MRRCHVTLALLGLLSLTALCPVRAQVSAAPALMNFQGRLAKPDGTPLADGTYTLTFSLYDALTGGNQKWTQTVNSVTVHNGVFAVLLNVNTPNLFNGNLWLQLQVGTDPALTPRQQLVSVAFAMKANTVPDGSLTAAKFASGAFNSLSWLLGGNSGTTPASNFLGTSDSQPLVFKTNNAEQMRLDAAGNLGLGTTTPGAKLHVFAPAGIGVFSGDLAPFGDSPFETNLAASRTHAWFAENGTRVFSVTAGGAGYFAGNVGIGTINPAAKLDVSGGINATTGAFSGAVTAPSATIPTLNGNVSVGGELTAKVVTITGGADVAEPYEVAGAGDVQPLPGYVVAIDPQHVGQMRVASRAYDRMVAGILSGANGIAPGIILRQQGTVADGLHPVASIGRVWCWCDADANGAIEAGDMLTTSNTPGHAMKVSDFNKANGSVIGKAMSSLKSGRGLVLVLVSLK
jgi:hypothetical protein